MLRRQSDLLLGILLTLILIGLAVSSILPPFLQGLVAFPIVLFVPGNALIRAIFPEANLTRLDRFLFTVGLSLGVVVLSGLALNITPWGLQTKSWLWILSLVILVTSVIALWRRWQISDMELTPVEFYIPLRQILLLGLAIVVIGLALKLTLTPHLPDNIQGYTSLWILPELGTQSDVLLIGIHSQELETTNYSLQITYNGKTYDFLYRNFPISAWNLVASGNIISAYHPDKVW